MPRGIYDRTKTKAQRSADKTSEAKADTAPKKRGRKPGSKNAASAAPAKAVTALKGSSHTKSTGSSFSGDYSEFNEIRSNLAILNALATNFKGVAGVQEEVAANVALLSELRQKHFPVKPTETIVEIASNGASQSQQYTTSVPLPPSPVQVIPPHS